MNPIIRHAFEISSMLRVIVSEKNASKNCCGQADRLAHKGKSVYFPPPPPSERGSTMKCEGNL